MNIDNNYDIVKSVIFYITRFWGYADTAFINKLNI